MDKLNEKLLTTFPDTIVCNGTTIECIAPPLEILKKMTAVNYDRNATASFQIRATDCISAKITMRSNVQHATSMLDEKGDAMTLSFEVYAIQPDANDSMVRLVCNLKQ